MLAIQYLKDIQNALKHFLSQKFNISEDQIMCESFLKCKFYLNIYYDRSKPTKVNDYFVMEQNGKKRIVFLSIEYRRFGINKLGIYAVVTKVE